MPKSLYDDLRSDQNLFAAWRHVKRSALNSKNYKIQGHASEFEHRHQTHLKTIQTQLRERRFKFDDVEGVLDKEKKRRALGKDPRPIAIGTIRNRVVQRAILQILQPRKRIDPSNPNSNHSIVVDERIGNLNRVNQSKYGIGGLIAPYGGVKPGIAQLMEAMELGAKYFFQTDIQAFFTKIKTAPVVEIIRQETNDPDLVQLFDDALVVNLANRDQLGIAAGYFPSDGIGVAQGSSLSAFAGNLLLFDLDHALNDMDVTAIRYIDDLFIISSSKDKLSGAVDHARQSLRALGFSIYEPSPDSSKAATGECKDGFTFLGCTIQPGRCVPSSGSKDRILAEVRDEFSKSRKAIERFVKTEGSFNSRHSRSATIERVGKKLYGWQKSFSFCTDGQVFRTIDGKVSRYLNDYDHIIHRKTLGAQDLIRVQALGLPNLNQMYLDSEITPPLASASSVSRDRFIHANHYSKTPSL